MNNFQKIAIALALLLSTPAIAKDSLPLKKGIYIDATVPCTSEERANIIAYFGNQLNSVHVVGHIKKVTKRGNVYKVSTIVEGDGGMGGNVSGPSTKVLEITSPTSFVQKGTAPRSFRWCRPRG